MLCRDSLRWALLLVLLVVLFGQLSEGKGGRSGGGRGGGRSGGSRSRGSSAARSSSSRSSSSSSKSSSGKGWFGSGSKSSKSSSSGTTWFTKTKSSTSRTGGGFKSSGSSHTWSTSHPRPSVTRESVSHGLFAPSHTVYYGSTSGCGFGGCGPSYTVYHYYPRAHYYSSGVRTTTTTPAPIGPKSDQVSSALSNNDTLIYTDGLEASNETQVAVIDDPARPIIIQDLAFFWDSKYLPSKDQQGCATYTPANANSTISFCNLNQYSRCQRNLKEVPNFQDIFFPDKTAPSHLAWLCPASTGCCDWECCYEGEDWSVGEIFWWSIIGFFGLFLLTKCCCSVWATYKQEEAEHRRKCEEREKLTRVA